MRSLQGDRTALNCNVSSVALHGLYKANELAPRFNSVQFVCFTRITRSRPLTDSLVICIIIQAGPKKTETQFYFWITSVIQHQF